MMLDRLRNYFINNLRLVPFALLLLALVLMLIGSLLTKLSAILGLIVAALGFVCAFFAKNLVSEVQSRLEREYYDERLPTDWKLSVEGDIFIFIRSDNKSVTVAKDKHDGNRPVNIVWNSSKMYINPMFSGMNNKGMIRGYLSLLSNSNQNKPDVFKGNFEELVSYVSSY